MSIHAGLYKNAKDNLKDVIKERCFHRVFCLCEDNIDIYTNVGNTRCNKCHNIIYKIDGQDEIKRIRREKNKFKKAKSFSRLIPIRFIDDIEILLKHEHPSMNYLKDDLIESINNNKFNLDIPFDYFIKITPENYRNYLKKYKDLDNFILFLLQQTRNFDKTVLILPEMINREIFSFL